MHVLRDRGGGGSGGGSCWVLAKSERGGGELTACGSCLWETGEVHACP